VVGGSSGVRKLYHTGGVGGGGGGQFSTIMFPESVWLKYSPIPVGRRGVISSFKWFLPAFLRVEEGGMVVGINSMDPWMDAKLNSETHLKHYFFRFLHIFEHVWLISLQQVLIWPQKYFFFKFFLTWVSKNAEFDVNGNEISIKFCVFFIPISKCCEKNICGVILALFTNFES
jgi:hypothetical protein